MCVHCPDYLQTLLDLSVTEGYDLPVVVGIDAVDVNGTMRTGPQLFGQFYPTPAVPAHPHGTAKYAFVDTVLLATVRRLCGSPVPPPSGLCDAYTAVLQRQRALFPTHTWSDPATGRNPTWP